MNTDPDQIRERVAALLRELPEIEQTEPGGVDPAVIEDVAHRLEQAHEVLVSALESVEKD